MKAPSSRRTWLKNAIGLLLLPLILWGMLRWFERVQVYAPTTGWSATGEALNRPWENVRFEATDGVSLSGWFFRAEASASSEDFVVLISHGNGGNISHRLDLYDLLLSMGWNVFAYDYRGYGRSDGRPSEEGTYRDGLGAYEWLRQKGFEGEQIIAYGESLGGAIAAELALRVKVAALCLQSTFTSVPDIGAELFPWLPVRRLATIHYDTLRKMEAIEVPVLILHSREDSIVPFEHGKRLFERAGRPKRLIELSGDHNDPIMLDREPIREGMEQIREWVLWEPSP